jgi:hypothetical protein
MKWTFVLVLLVTGCGKSRLDGEYASFKGRYTWKYTKTVTGSGLSTSASSGLSASVVPFTAEIELDNKGRILFYKDGGVVSSNKYTIQDKESNQYGGKTLQIRLRGKHNMNINEDKLQLVLSFDTALEVDKFPFPSLDEVESFKTGHRDVGNVFAKR